MVGSTHAGELRSVASLRARNATAKAKSNQSKTFGCLRCAQETGIGPDCLYWAPLQLTFSVMGYVPETASFIIGSDESSLLSADAFWQKRLKTRCRLS
jgi:hypothetical protein